ncbi:UNVERIFIED_CONTAM: hypothetical protein FKN15_023173 [Acipenser sinensis]
MKCLREKGQGPRIDQYFLRSQSSQSNEIQRQEANHSSQDISTPVIDVRRTCMDTVSDEPNDPCEPGSKPSLQFLDHHNSSKVTRTASYGFLRLPTASYGFLRFSAKVYRSSSLYRIIIDNASEKTPRLKVAIQFRGEALCTACAGLKCFPTKSLQESFQKQLVSKILILFESTLITHVMK